ncbi:hypothetical protein ANCCAN_08285, partial [Ancylostoma caninum]
LYFGKNLKRSRDLQRVEVHILSVTPQLSDILPSKIRDIIELHKSLHEKRNVSQVQSEDRSDVRQLSSFYNNIEPVQEFLSNEITILLSISLDGFVPRRLSCRNVWPLYVRIDDLPRKEGNEYVNSMIAGVAYTHKKPSDIVCETLFSRLEREVMELSNQPINVDVDGVVWKIKVKIHRGVVDMDAQKAMFGLPRWNSAHGCSKCHLEGRRSGMRRLWLLDENEEIRMRSRESFIADGRAGLTGIPSKTLLH